ncbi:MAG TPA: ATP-binding protein [Anaerolineae bacterium]|nr:ATP-binding protein [Anaerolineae bacterium]
MARELRTSSRGYRTEFEQSIQGDIVRALVELITNSDDSYTRAKRDGPINVVFEGHQRGDPRKTERVSVTDQAQGMTEDQIDAALGEVGGSTSGFSAHKSVRGLLGRGLKQAAFGIGAGVDVVSIKGGTVGFGRLYESERGRLMFSRGSEFEKDFGLPDHSPRRAMLAGIQD